MASQLWLLRHGEAESHAERPDFERRLTERGRGQSLAAGRALRALGVVIQLAATSPRVRAHETARLCCGELGIEPVVHEPLAGGFDRDEALVLLRSAGPQRRVLVVGHQPDLGQVVYDLTGARVDFKKGGLAAVRVDGSRGELIALLRPREIDLLANAGA